LDLDVSERLPEIAADARVLEMREAFEGSDADRVEVHLGNRRIRVSADPERQFRVEAVFELPLEGGDSRPWCATPESPIRGSGERHITDEQRPSVTPRLRGAIPFTA
jgi:hypothetical protein